MPRSPKPKPHINEVLQGISIDDRLGALVASFRTRDDVVATITRTMGFIAFLGSKLATTDRCHFACAMRDLADHVERHVTTEMG